MSTKTANKSKHELLHHPINFSHAMHLVTGVTSLYLLGFFFAMLGFVSGYALGSTNSSAPSSQVETTVPAEDIDIFVQELLNEEVLENLDESVLGVSDETDNVEFEVFEPIRGGVVEEPPVDIQVNEPTTSITVDDSVLVQAPASNTTAAALPGDAVTYGLVISMAGMVYGLNLMHEEEDEKA